MRNAILQMPDQRSSNEHRLVLRAALRQLERAEIYLAAVAYMDLGDPAAGRLLTKVRADLRGLHDHLAATRSEIRP